MKNVLNVVPIAHIKTDYKEKFGIPRQSGRVPLSEGRIVFEPEYRDEAALREIDGFSHLWLIFGFSEVKNYEWTPTVRPPRLGGNVRVGVFASRSPFRPNGLGLSCVKLLRIDKTEKEGSVLVVSGADLLDGTPIYDIKPYLSFSDCHSDANCGYADNMKNYTLDVKCSLEVEEAVPKDILNVIIQCISEDPRPSYHDDDERVYYMKYANYDVEFKVQGKCAYILSVKQL